MFWTVHSTIYTRDAFVLTSTNSRRHFSFGSFRESLTPSADRVNREE